MIKNAVTIDKELVRKMSKKSLILSLAIGLVGVLGCIPFLVLYLLNTDKIYFVIIFTVFLSFGAIGTYNFFKVVKTNKRALDAKATLQLEIDQKRIVIKRSSGQDLPIDYARINYYSETEKYIFIHLGKNYTFPILKDENYQTIIGYFEKHNIIKK